MGIGAQLRALTPEQMYWLILELAGLVAEDRFTDALQAVQAEQSRREAADDMAMDARMDADQEARDLGYHDAECRAEIEMDAMHDEIAAAS